MIRSKSFGWHKLTARGASSPAKPALHIPEPLSITSYMDIVSNFWLWVFRAVQNVDLRQQLRLPFILLWESQGSSSTRRTLRRVLSWVRKNEDWGLVIGPPIAGLHWEGRHDSHSTWLLFPKGSSDPQKKKLCACNSWWSDLLSCLNLSRREREEKSRYEHWNLLCFGHRHYSKIY